jgi:hypothetical protein
MAYQLVSDAENCSAAASKGFTKRRYPSTRCNTHGCNFIVFTKYTFSMSYINGRPFVYEFIDPGFSIDKKYRIVDKNNRV